MRRKNRELDPRFGHQFQRLQIDRRFRQPEPFRHAAEPVFEVADAPHNLRSLVAAVRQRQDDVVVSLSQRRTMSRKDLLAVAVCLTDRFVQLRPLRLEPRQQRRSVIEADPRVVIGDLDDPLLTVEDSRGCVRLVTFSGDPLVPVVIGVG